MKASLNKTAIMLSVAALALTAGVSNAQADTTNQSAAAAPDQNSATWISKISLGGDFRFRFDSVNDSAAGSNGNLHEVMRARLVTKAKVTDQITANFRLTTGPGTSDPTTSNQGLGSAGSTGNQKKGVYFDVASLDYAIAPAMTIGAGKTMNPFFSAGQNDLIWDSDVTFEGLNFRYQRDMGSWHPFFNLEHNMLADRTVTTSETTLTGVQLGSSMNTDRFVGTLALTEYYYANMLNNQTAFSTSAKGNTLGTGGVYANDFHITNVELELGTHVNDTTAKFYASYVTNPAATDKKNGYLLGLRYGDVKAAGTWMVDYNYRKLENDAVVGAFTDGDFGGGGTDVQGHRVMGKYGIADNTALMLTGIFASKNVSAANTGYTRWQLDLLAAF